MDATDYPSLRRLTVLNAQLARQGRQVEAMVDLCLDDVDQLLMAAALRDWEAVLRLSEQLVAEFKDASDRVIVRSAEQLCESLRRDPSGAMAPIPLAELLSACRAAKMRPRLR